MESGSKKWSIAEARRNFADLIDAAAQGPQPVFNRTRLVAMVVDPDLFQEFARWDFETRGRSIGSAFGELRSICAAEGYSFDGPAAGATKRGSKARS